MLYPEKISYPETLGVHFSLKPEGDQGEIY
jgi:hypothetical protein